MYLIHVIINITSQKQLMEAWELADPFIVITENTPLIICDCPKMLAALTAAACGVYLTKEAYEIWQESRKESTAWLRKHGYMRTQAYDSYPDLSVHNSAMASHLTAEVYEVLKHRKTEGKFTLERAIQVGVDCPGKPWERLSGVIAGDKETYETFSILFDKIIEDLHGFGINGVHRKDISTQGIESGDFDGKYVKSTRLTVLRSLHGYRFPAACSRQERRGVEHALRLALCRMKGEYKGEYFALSDLTDTYKKRLSARMLLPDPTIPIIACSGRARDWPDARGIFISNDKSFMVLVNEVDHLKVVCLSKEAHLIPTFKKLYRGLALLENELKRNGEEFVWNDHLGYIVSDPVNLGTGLDIRVRVKLRRLCVDNRLHFILSNLHLKRCRKGIQSVNIPKGEFYVYTEKTLGVTEVQMLKVLIKGVRKLIQLEIVLERGEDIDEMLPKKGYGHKQLDCSAADIVTR